MSEALDMMKNAHARSKERMMGKKPCEGAEEAHMSVVDGILNSHSDNEILFKSNEDIKIAVENITHTLGEIKKGVLNNKGNGSGSPAPSVPTPAPTLSGKPNVTKLKTKWFEVTTNQIEVGSTIVAGLYRTIIIAAIIAAFVMGPKALKWIKGELVSEVKTHVEQVVSEDEPSPTP